MSDFFTMMPGETAAPVPDGPVLCPASAGMKRIHRVFLWAYDEAPGLARSAAHGDTARATYVADVLANFDKLLHVPTVRLKEPAAGAQGAHYAATVRHLFGLGEDERR